MADVLPPHSAEAEEAVLGSLMIDPAATSRVAVFLTPSDFYIVKNGWIYDAILTVGEKADLLTISAELASRNLLEEIGGESYLAQLTTTVPTALNVEAYGHLVEDFALRRRMINAASNIAKLAYDQTLPVEQVIEKSESAVFSVSDERVSGQMAPIRKVVDEFFQRIEYLHEHRDEPLGIPTGYPDLDKLTGGLQKGDLIIIAARPGVGKCVTADTRIVDPVTGERHTIANLVHRRKARLLTLHDDYKLREADGSDFVDDGIKPVYRVVTALGREIEVTLSHPFLTICGWQPLANLKVGEAVAVPRVIASFGTDDTHDYEAKVLGYLIGDRCLTGRNPAFTNTDDRLRLDFSSAAKEFPGTGANGLTAWLQSLGIWGKVAAEKRVPDVVYRFSRRKLAIFINRLYACDGSVYFQDNHPRLSYSTMSSELARDVQHLLLRFGIVAKLRSKRFTYREQNRTSYELVVTDKASLQTFCDHIGVFGKEDRSWQSLYTDIGLPPRSNLHVGQRSPSRQRLFELGTAVGSIGLVNLAQSDVYWDRIVAIEYAGQKQVYDLTVPGTHNFVADDMIVHNTSLMNNIGYHAAFKHRQRVAIFTLEMSNEQLVQRFVASETGIDSQRLRVGDLRDEEWGALTKVCMQMADLYIFLDDTPALSPLDLRVKSRRIYQEYGLDLIIVDYLQLMQGEGNSRSDNRVQEISYISRALKGIARELKVPLIAGSQLSRLVEQRSDKHPMLSDLRESGSIEQDSDIVMFIYRDEVYNPDTEFKNIAEISVAKNRNGPTGKASLFFDKHLTSFKNLAKEKIQL